jgi:PAS domain S-box-containing protein
MISLAFFLFVVIGGLSFSVDRLVLARLQRFVAAARQFGRGDFSQDIPETSRDEIGQLAEAFNQMAADLRRSQAIRERKDLLENVLNTVAESVVIMDEQGRVVACNRAFGTLFGGQEEGVLGAAYPSLTEPRARLWSAVQDGRPHTEELHMKRFNGQTFPAKASLIPLKDERDRLLGFVEVVQDLSEAKAREAMHRQLIQAEKAAAVGRLAAGVAHELNNPLGNILLFSKLLLETCPPGDERRENLARVVENAMRTKRIISALLDFTRSRDIRQEPCDLKTIAQESLEMLGPSLRQVQIDVSIHAQEPLPRVICDRSQLQQVFINLIQNAIHAIGAQGALEIFIRSDKDSQQVVFGVKDTGPGIPEENLADVFEPFYSTKEDGCGLGLSICYGIVERHGGQIWVENNTDGPGCTFYVSLPLAGAQEEASPAER